MGLHRYIVDMPPPQQPKAATHPELEDRGLSYPQPAFEFIEEGLRYTVTKVHGAVTDAQSCRHVSGQQLCEGLRELAVARWGMLARTVLRHWNISSTLDFGRIVFALIDRGQMQRTDDDTVEDFRNVYDFRGAFESGYRIPAAS